MLFLLANKWALFGQYSRGCERSAITAAAAGRLIWCAKGRRVARAWCRRRIDWSTREKVWLRQRREGSSADALRLWCTANGRRGVWLFSDPYDAAVSTCNFACSFSCGWRRCWHCQHRAARDPPERSPAPYNRFWIIHTHEIPVIRLLDVCPTKVPA